jgi:hypothetical protein
VDYVKAKDLAESFRFSATLCPSAAMRRAADVRRVVFPEPRNPLTRTTCGVVDEEVIKSFVLSASTIVGEG